jgi:hypothetical protein
VPFTPSHAAAVVPLLGRRGWARLDGTCLVLGSMAPDFEYLLRGRLASTWAHTPAGILCFGVPITLLLAALTHVLVKWPLLGALPDGLGRRLAPWAARSWPRQRGPLAPAGFARLRGREALPEAAVLLVSAALGNLTHVVWDGFTHRQGWAVQGDGALATFVVAVPGLGRMALYRLLQHASTLVGLAVLATLSLRGYRRQPGPALPAVPRRGSACSSSSASSASLWAPTCAARCGGGWSWARQRWRS